MNRKADIHSFRYGYIDIKTTICKSWFIRTEYIIKFSWRSFPTWSSFLSISNLWPWSQWYRWWLVWNKDFSQLIFLRLLLDDLPFDEGNSYDYTTAIQERLKKANEELEHDQTPSELKHSQRVSFDAIVKAVDIIQDPNEHEHEHIDPIVRPSISPVTEESNATINSPRSDTSTHEYTVPLNDTQPKEGLSLLEQIKALQFHGILPAGERWATTAHNVNNDSLSNRDGRFSFYFKILFAIL